MAKVFITKYALTAGIKEMEGEIFKSTYADNQYYVRDRSYMFYYIGKDAFLDKSDALKKAEEMRKKKIASLKKQISKLEKMTF